MKKIIFFFAVVLIAASILAQAPDKLSYQAVVRDANGKLVTSHSVGMRVSILQGTESGTAVYVETSTATTNTNGLVSIMIGGGTIVTGTFTTINWAAGPYFLKTETDPAGGTSYSITGVSQLLSVPYALYAKTAGNGFSGNYNDLISKPDLSIYIQNSNTAKWDKDSTDNVTLTGNQTIAGNKTFTGTISANNKTITNIATPTANTDAANKAYVDALKKEMNRMKELVYGNYVYDIDSNIYKTITIGTQVWMAENLKVTHYRNGGLIPNVTDNTTWTGLTTGARCYGDNDSATYARTYGALYNWYTVADTRNVCPTGWHIPTETEWTTLETYLGGSSVAGGKMKETGTIHWGGSNIGATNTSGFTALPGGFRGYDDGLFYSGGTYNDLWSATENSTTLAVTIILYSTSAVFDVQNYAKKAGFNVRCIKD